MAIREKFGLGYLSSGSEEEERSRSRSGDNAQPGERPLAERMGMRRGFGARAFGFADESISAAFAAVGEKVLVALRSTPSKSAEFSHLVSVTGHPLPDLFPVIQRLTERGLVKSDSGLIQLTAAGEEAHSLRDAL